MDIARLYAIYKRTRKVSTDTRADIEGSIFFCLKGPNFDANAFAEKALAQGALHVVADDPALAGKENITVTADALDTLQELARHHRSHLKCPVIGLTGSNGKTTNKELIAAVLEKKYAVTYTRGNLNNHIGVPLTLLSVPADAEMAVIEMGANHQGEIKALSEIARPDFGMITNIGKAHLEGFGGLEGVRKGKGELFDFLRKNSDHRVFLNADDPVLTDMARGMNAVTFGTREGAYITGQPLGGVNAGLRYRQGDFESDEIVTELTGGFNFVNILAAVCIGRYFGVDHAAVKEALEAYRPTQNRSQSVKTERNTVILDAYNANPSSMAFALAHFAERPEPNKIAILGQMHELGASSEEEHAALVEQVRTLGLEAFFVGPLFGAADTSGFRRFDQTSDLLAHLQNNPLRNRTVLLKGSRLVALEKAVEVL